MKNFLYKHILFPKENGIQPYIWLIFLVPTLAGLISYPLWQQLIAFVLILIFLKAYRDAYAVREIKTLTRSFAVQIVITLFLAINPWFQTFGIQTFTGFEMGFWRISEKRWRIFLVIYYVVAVLSYAVPFSEFGFQGISPSSWVWIFVGTVFILISPFFSKMINRSYVLSAENKNLEARVRRLERERIAYDLHDNLGQSFSTIALQAELAGKLIDKKPEAAKQELEKISQSAHESLTLVREIVANLKKEDSVQGILTEASEALKIAEIKLTITGDGDAFPSPFSAVLKEALTNVVRHSQAKNVQVAFIEDNQQYQLTITDDGVGLENSQPSHGMLGMKKRVEEAGGKISVTSNNGTSITVVLRKESI